jgi:hypothetical protein
VETRNGLDFALTGPVPVADIFDRLKAPKLSRNSFKSHLKMLRIFHQKKELPNRQLFLLVLEMGLEPISLAACDFESHVYTIPPLQQWLGV